MNKKIAIIGYGYWGPNLLRNFSDSLNCEVIYCCDQDKSKLEQILKKYPNVKVTSDIKKVLSDKQVDAVVLATPTRTHFPLAKQAIEAGKDVLIEKPMVLNTKEAYQLVEISRKHKRIVMVDHTFLFSDAVIKAKNLIDQGDIGEVIYIDSIRCNLGLFQRDTNVIYDLASHDFSIIQFLLNERPKTIQANAEAHFGTNEDVAYIFARYSKGITAHVHVSWLAPVKIRRMLIVGTKKMIVYDDVESTEKIKIYDKGVIAEKSQERESDIKVGYRTGDILIPKINIVEPLAILVEEFINVQESREYSKSGIDFGSQIIEILELATKSARNGRMMHLKD